jgi:hypothetical protein
MMAGPEIIGVSGTLRLADVSFKHEPNAVNSPGRAVRYICASQLPSSHVLLRPRLVRTTPDAESKLPEVPGYTLGREGRRTALRSGERPLAPMHCRFCHFDRSL